MSTTHPTTERTDDELTSRPRTCETPSCHSRQGVRSLEGADGDAIALCRYCRKHFRGGRVRMAARTPRGRTHLRTETKPSATRTETVRTPEGEPSDDDGDRVVPSPSSSEGSSRPTVKASTPRRGRDESADRASTTNQRRDRYDAGVDECDGCGCEAPLRPVHRDHDDVLLWLCPTCAEKAGGTDD